MDNSTERRKITRTDADFDMTISHPSSPYGGLGHVINISVPELLFSTKIKLTEGSALHITIESITPPLSALVEVKRINALGNNEFNVTATIEGIKAS